MCEVRDRGSDGPVLWIDPRLYSVLRPVVEGKMSCMVELHFTNAGLAKTSLKVDGDRAADILTPVTATLQSGVREVEFKIS
jgi:hypothetical protein